MVRATDTGRLRHAFVPKPIIAQYHGISLHCRQEPALARDTRDDAALFTPGCGSVNDDAGAVCSDHPERHRPLVEGVSVGG